MTIRIFFEGRLSGLFDSEKKMFLMKRDKEAHMFRKYQGIGLSLPVIGKLAEFGCEVISMSLLVGGQVNDYLVGFEVFKNEGIGYDNEGDYQLILPLDKWTRLEKNTIYLKRWIQ